jgi:hypothetical protein
MFEAEDSEIALNVVFWVIVDARLPDSNLPLLDGTALVVNP